MTWDEVTKLVEELVTLNDGYLSERVFLTNDVQNCLEFLYDILHGGVDRGKFE